MAAYKEVYYDHPEDKIQDLISQAKLHTVWSKLFYSKVFEQKSNQAQSELLKIFHNFLTKYVTMLYYNKYNINDYDIRRFIALWVKDPIVGRSLLRNKLNKQGFRHVAEVMDGIHYMIQRYGDEEDVRQTVSMTFFQCVMKYTAKQSKIKPDEVVPFKGYIYSYFFYLLKKNIDALHIDQLGRKTFPLIGDDDFNGEEESDEKIQGFTAPPEQSAEEEMGTEEIDEFWVAGDTTMWPFTELSQQERQLVKWRFVDGYRSSEIADKITEHPNTVREHFNRLRIRLNEIIGEDLLQEESTF